MIYDISTSTPAMSGASTHDSKLPSYRSHPATSLVANLVLGWNYECQRTTCITYHLVRRFKSLLPQSQLSSPCRCSSSARTAAMMARKVPSITEIASKADSRAANVIPR